jgi:hypothetical protein
MSSLNRKTHFPFFYQLLLNSKLNEIDEDDLEDGEIEDDDDEVLIVPEKPVEPQPQKIEEKLPSPKASPKRELKKVKQKSKDKNHDKKDKEKSKKSEKSSKRAKEARSLAEDDFASSIESQLASVLKKDGVEPPMPSVKKITEESIAIDSDHGERTHQNPRKRKKKSQRNSVEVNYYCKKIVISNI